MELTFNEVVALVQKHAKNLLPSVTLAQLFLESGYRPNSKMSSLATDYNNLFGIKKGNWKGKTIVLDTKEDDGTGKLYTIKGEFRWYDSPEQSIEDHDNLFTSSEWLKNYYKDVLSAKTPQTQADALQGTYATDTRYSEKLMSLIKQYNLTQYDTNKGDDNMAVTAEQVLKVFRTYIGMNKGSEKHKQMVKDYNSVSPKPVGYTLKTSDDYCDAGLTVVFDKAGASDLIGRECGVERHKSILKQKNIWLGLVRPQVGDIVIWRWDGNRNGFANHIGIVEKVSGNTITTIEFNTVVNGVSTVARRTYAWNSLSIQGYARPKYGKTTTTDEAKDSKEVSQHIVVTVDNLRAFNQPSGSGAIVENIKKDFVKNIDMTIEAEGYLWGGWISSADGKRRYTTLQTSDGKRKFVDIKQGTIGHGGKTYTDYLKLQEAKKQPTGGDEPKLADNEVLLDGKVYVIKEK